MESTGNKYLDVVLKLNRLTASEEEHWREIGRSRQPPDMPRKIPYEEGYVLPRDGKLFVIVPSREYHKHERIEKYNSVGLRRRSPVSSLAHRFAMQHGRPRLMIFDQQGRKLFTFPDLQAVEDLYQTIRFKDKEVESFLDDFLQEDG